MHNRGPEIVCEPERETWKELLLSAKRRNTENSGGFDCLKRDIRAEVFRAAQEFQEHLIRISGLTGIADFQSVPASGMNSSMPLLMSGHQPLIYHPGLVVKLSQLSSFAGEAGGPGINIIVDTDEGDGGAFCYPGNFDGELPRLLKSSFSAGSGIFLFQHLLPEAEQRKRRDEVIRSLEESQMSGAAAGFSKAAVRLEKLAGYPVVDAHAILLSLYPFGRGVLQLPLSRLLNRKPVQNFFGSILLDYREFWRAYNDILDTHRVERKIKNLANPFPNLKWHEDLFEMPFWLIDSLEQKRFPLFIREEGGTLRLFKGGSDFPIPQSAEGKGLGPGLENGSLLLCPRGAMITILLRMLCSDFFIHGLGGARYDAVADALMAEYFHAAPPPFVIVSGNRYLFERLISKHEESVFLKSKLRSVSSHLGDFLGKGLFEASEERELDVLMLQREEIVSELKRRTEAHETAASVLSEAKKLDSRIRDVVEKSALHEKTAMADLPEDILDAIYCREYPFMMFENPQCQA